MAFDKSKPQGSQKIRLGDDDIRANNYALEEAIAEGHEFITGGNQTGKHTTPIFIDNGEDPSQPTATNEVRIANNTGILRSIAQSGEKRDLGPIPSGTKMLFKQNSAPVGWTFASEDNDKIILNTGTEADGADTGGSWTIGGVTINGTALTSAQIPKHRHKVSCANTVSCSQKCCAFGCIDATGGIGSPVLAEDHSWYDKDQGDHQLIEDSFGNTEGGTDSHSHTYSSDGNWRPAYVKCITCSKD